MKKEIWVHFKSRNVYEDGNDDFMEFKTEGTFFEKDGKYFLKYEEKNEYDKVTVTIKTEDKKVTILRFGEINTQMTIEKGRKHINNYETPQGLFEISINATSVDVDIKENKGSIKLCYDVELNGVKSSSNTIEIEFN